MQAVEDFIAWSIAHPQSPVPADWVPGATLQERTRLSACGSLMKTLTHATSWKTFFSEPDIRNWLEEATLLPEELAKPLRNRTVQQSVTEFAFLYSAAMSGPSRRPLGTFFTPQPEAEMMLDLWDGMADPPTNVVDVGAGVGVFTHASLDRWKTAAVTAVDINPITLGLLLTALEADPAAAARVDTALDDYISWTTNASFKKLDRVLYLGNPPYTRASLLKPETRARLVEHTNGLTKRRSNLASHMTALTLLRLRPQDGLCFVVPANWTETDNTAGLRNYLTKLTNRDIAVRFVESSMFDDAEVDAVVIAVSPEREIGTFYAGWWYERENITDERPGNDQEWKNLGSKRSGELELSPPSGKRLGDYYAISRGVATGANAFFIASSNESPSFGAIPIITKIRVDEKGRDTPVQRYLHVIRPDSIPGHSELSELVTEGEKLGVDKRTLCAKRKNWYDLSAEIKIPDLIMSPMSRTRFRFIYNSSGATLTNNLYGLTAKEGNDTETLRKIYAWLNSEEGQAVIAHHARRQANGLLKIEPKALLNLPVTDVL
ncbi:Eco57I restriction-modification methylase domain-containing protein [Curtobacterium sp. WHRI 8282]|uniref:Eco57I restriction-modification methylase domain-containing protein n=1 Tax=Curtobacterium sp. WHRI 8282 TaxID=3162559 RepID=UPI0032F068FB